MHFLKRSSIFLLLLAASHFDHCFARPDFTMITPYPPKTGLGNVPKFILECIGDQVSVNLIAPNEYNRSISELPPHTIRALKNPDKAAGNVCMFAGIVWTSTGSELHQMPKDGKIKMVYSMLETTKIPSEWVRIFNQEIDAVVVPDDYVKKMYENCGVKTPIFVLPIPMTLDPYLQAPLHQRNPKKPFVFIDMAAYKSPPIVVKAFALAFGNTPDVQLIVRAGGSGEFNLCDPKRLRMIINIIKMHHLNNVKLEGGLATFKEYLQKLTNSDCYINISLGEGYSFIPREALALGLPSIIADNTAAGTLCKSGFLYGVRSQKPRQSNLHYKTMFGDECGHQFECELDDVVKAMRDVYDHYEFYLNQAHLGREWVKQYDCNAPSLRERYRTLIKPQKIVLGDRNEIEGDTLITNSASLYDKYLDLK